MTSPLSESRHAALAAFWDARTEVLSGLALGGRDSDLLDLVETVFLARLDGDGSPLAELTARGGHDIADVRRWWSGWDGPGTDHLRDASVRIAIAARAGDLTTVQWSGLQPSPVDGDTPEAGEA